MRTFIETDAIMNVPESVRESLRKTLWRLNRLVELEEYPPFKEAALSPSHVHSLSNVVTETEVGIRFTQAVQDEYWSVSEVYAYSTDEESQLATFEKAFVGIFNEFADAIATADAYADHYRNSEDALVAEAIRRTPKLEEVWDVEARPGFYRCDPCELNYEDLQVDPFADHRCSDCGGVLRFDWYPEVGVDYEFVGRAGTIRRLINRVVEARIGRRTGWVATATTGQILRESSWGRRLRPLWIKIRRRR